MQISQSDVVRVRRARWRVIDIREFHDCRLLRLTGLDPSNAGVERHVLTPFDEPERLERRQFPTSVSPQRWRQACRGFIAADTPPGSLRCARDARIELLPHQLAPALAVLRGLGVRVLLADDVGLGKTIQAGLIVSELRARGVADRVLIVTPAGLRDQWAHEFLARFEITAQVLDVRALRFLVAAHPVGVNPWSTAPVAIVSVDFIKRPEVLAAASACQWDVMIVDEAHGVAGDSDRRAAVSALAGRASYILLLTATPHSGDRRSFASLCNIGGRRGEPLLVFRRTRQDVRPGTPRRIQTLHVRMRHSEIRMYDLLHRFSGEVSRYHGGLGRACWLALSVLHKRALSSAHSLALSVNRRLAALRSASAPSATQPSLPLSHTTGELTDADETPEWSPLLVLPDVERERRLLGALARAASSATRHESKIAALARLLRRAREPAIVFTEYRDTLLYLDSRLRVPAALLHGGMASDERRWSLERFGRGEVRVLLATDAAGQGLNLQSTCRLVVNLELPWNPSRLEQRIGRVDRIGQRRTVHVIHLVARPSAETAILQRLKNRVAVARFDIRGANPLDHDDADALPPDAGGDAADFVQPHSAADGPDSADLQAPTLTREAELEVNRIANARRFAKSTDASAVAHAEGVGPLIARTRHSRTREALGGRALAIWLVVAEDGAGRHIGSTIVAGLAGDWRRFGDPDVIRLIERAGQSWRDRLSGLHEAFFTTCLTRERGMGSEAVGRAVSQPGLFDRRSERTRVASALAQQSAAERRLHRIAALERARLMSFLPPQLVLVLTP
jgi:superfamily II DNA or RNA helicase